MKIYVAIEGEYEVATPLAVFINLEQAKKAVEDRKASFGGEVCVYDSDTGEYEGEYEYREEYHDDRPWGERFGPWAWSEFVAGKRDEY